MDSHCHYKFTAESAEQNQKTEDRGQKTAIRPPLRELCGLGGKFSEFSVASPSGTARAAPPGVNGLPDRT